MKDWLVDWLVLSLIGSFIVMIGFFCTDCVCGHSKTYDARILGHEYKPSWTDVQTVTDDNGHGSHVTTTHHPEEYHLICGEIGGDNTFDCETVRSKYYAYTNAQEVTVYTREGKWTGAHYFNNVGPKQQAEKGW